MARVRLSSWCRLPTLSGGDGATPLRLRFAGAAPAAARARMDAAARACLEGRAQARIGLGSAA